MTESERDFINGTPLAHYQRLQKIAAESMTIKDFWVSQWLKSGKLVGVMLGQIEYFIPGFEKEIAEVNNFKLGVSSVIPVGMMKPLEIYRVQSNPVLSPVICEQFYHFGIEGTDAPVLLTEELVKVYLSNKVEQDNLDVVWESLSDNKPKQRLEIEHDYVG